MANQRSNPAGAEDMTLRTAVSATDSPLSPTSTFVASPLSHTTTALSEKSLLTKGKDYGLTSVETGDSSSLEKGPGAPVYRGEDGSELYNVPPETAKDLITEVLHVEDDPTLNPWTFRTWFLGV
jgi:hypothetical protein